MSWGEQPRNVGVGTRFTEDITEKDVIDPLQRILGRTEKQREETVANLNMFKKNNFHRNSISATLPRGIIVEDGNTVYWVEGVWEDRSWKETRRETLEHLGKGAFGSVYKGTSGHVYKRVEGIYKEVYREALIQSVLSSDKLHGQHICKIEALYRDKDDEKPFFYFKMEAVDMTLAQYLDYLASPDKKIDTPQLAHILIEIVKSLDYFKKAYGFSHNDLHSNNIMINLLDNGDYIFMLIDFGMSCIEVNNVMYKHRRGCRYYDNLILADDLNIFGGDKKGPDVFSESCKKILNMSVTNPHLIEKFIDYQKFINFWENHLQRAKGGSTRRKRRRSRVRSTHVRPTRVRSTHVRPTRVRSTYHR